LINVELKITVLWVVKLCSVLDIIISEELTASTLVVILHLKDDRSRLLCSIHAWLRNNRAWYPRQ